MSGGMTAKQSFPHNVCLGFVLPAISWLTACSALHVIALMLLALSLPPPAFAGRSFGGAVSISGDVLVIGAQYANSTPSTSGAAYVYERNGESGKWERTAKLLPSDAETLAYRFGVSVSVSGDIIVVGSDSRSTPGGDRVGAAYVFVKPGGGWSGTLAEDARLTAWGAAAFSDFGSSVSVAGSTVVVGAHGADGERGAAYVFVEPAGGWSGALTQDAKLISSAFGAYSRFGNSVAVSGDTVVVGAESEDAVDVNSGAAYVFVEPGGGWSDVRTENAKLLATDTVAHDELGASIAISGSAIVVGATGNAGAHGDSGSAYVFVEPAGGWSGTLSEDAKLIGPDAFWLDSFGHASAISGDTVVVGHHDGYTVHVFEKPLGDWSGTLSRDAELFASHHPSTQFGRSVGVSGGTAVAGAPAYNMPHDGAAYVFEKSAGEDPANWEDESADQVAQFGDVPGLYLPALGTPARLLLAGLLLCLYVPSILLLRRPQAQ
jgi:hypothetical protein